MSNTYGTALAEIGVSPIEGGDLVICHLGDRGMRNFIAQSVWDQPIPSDTNVYLAGGLFSPGTVSEWSGRKQENLKAVLYLQFDADLSDYSGMPQEILHQLPQKDIDRWIESQRLDLEEVCTGVGIPLHRIDYTGYGICAYTYLQPVESQDIATIRDAHKAFIKAINDRAGIKLVDVQASDSGSRVTRIPGSYNVKNSAMPRLVKTLRYDAHKHVSMDQIRFALKRAGEQERVRAEQPKPVMMPATVTDEIIAALAPHWTLGQKHSMALAVSGILAKAGVPETQALAVVEQLSREDTDQFDRVKCVQDSYARMASGLDVRGFHSLKDMVPDSVIQYVDSRIQQVRNATAPVTISSVLSPAQQAKENLSREKSDEKYQSNLDILPVPSSAYAGWVGDYVSMMLPLSEAPEQFHLASGLGLIGATAGRKVSARYVSKNLYANLYLMIVGVAGYSRKDTAIEFAINMPDHKPYRTSENVSPYQVLTDVGSPQGLMERLQNHSNIWLYVTEYERLAANAHRSSTPIFPLLTTAWNTPNKLQNITKGSAIEAQFPYLSTIAAVQPDILARHMLPEDISNGFASRWLFVPGLGGDPIAEPPDIDESAAFELYGRLLHTIDLYNNDGQGTRLYLSPEAKERWEEWYINDVHVQPETDDEASMRSRLGVHIRKLALVYAIGAGERKAIQLDHLESAIAFVEWSWAHTQQMMKGWGVSLFNAIEEKIRLELSRENGAMQKWILNRKCRSRRWGTVEYVKVFDAMVKSGEVVIDAAGEVSLATNR